MIICVIFVPSRSVYMFPDNEEYVALKVIKKITEEDMARLEELKKVAILEQ